VPGNVVPAAVQTRASIRVPVWIVDADHDEAIRHENTLYMAHHIPGGRLLIEPGVSHFSFLQDTEQFTRDIEHFLGHPCDS
jgi:pimeloyl-ACP methyl ester carboxylesterase